VKRIAIESCHLSIQELAKLAETEPVVLTRAGNPVLAIVGVDEAEVEAWSLGSNPDFLAMRERFRGRGRREGGIPLAQVRRRLGIPKRTSSKFDREEEAEE
jgi:antitoxin (DNA-binding transcriptional repressor) of toxin-antitoxin stability system